MPDAYPLITTVVFSVVFAFIFGFIANRVRLPTIFGYLMAGMMLGPYTPGFVANIDLAKQLAEIGIILLMFGVGLHFSPHDLMVVRRIALPGAIVQIAVTTAISVTVAMMMQHHFFESLVFGLTLSVASTVVLLRAFEQEKIIHSHVGKVGVGWLIAEDMAMIVAVVMLPVIADMMTKGANLNLRTVCESLFIVIIKISAFIIVMIAVGKRLLPKLLIAINKTKSRELMSLGTLAISSGFAFIAYTVFGASFALGAFTAGLILNESEIGKKSAEKSLPLRDIFSVLFFISAGMLFDPRVLPQEPGLVLLAILIVVVVKPLTAYFIMRFFHQNRHNSWLVAAGLGQIGEFSFILTALALKLGMFSQILYDMVIASALISITLNPFMFRVIKKFKRNLE